MASSELNCRFIHCSDLHLDSSPSGLSNVVPFRDASRQALRAIVSKALEFQVDFLVIAGDLYDGALRDTSPIIFFNAQMQRLAEAGIPVFVIKGNHDADNKAIRDLAAPLNVHVFLPGAPSCVELDQVAVHGWSYGQEAEPDFRASAYPKAVSSKLNVGILHTGLEAAGPYAPCKQADLFALGYDYWALGHIHQYQVWRQERSAVVYSGMPQGRAIDELGEKGACLVKLEAGQSPEIEFFKTSVLDWIIAPVDASGIKSERALGDLVRRAYEAALSQSPSVALRLQVSNVEPSLFRQRDALLDQFRRSVPEETADRAFLENLVFKLASKDEAGASPSLTGAASLLSYEGFQLEEVLEELASPLRKSLGALALSKSADGIDLEGLLADLEAQELQHVLDVALVDLNAEQKQDAS